MEPLSLLLGRLSYDWDVSALDRTGFDRILRGFDNHFQTTPDGNAAFNFARREGYVKVGNWDAFGLIDSGRVEWVTGTEQEAKYGGNVVSLMSRSGRLHFRFNIQVVLIFWAFALFVLAWIFGGFPMFWVAAWGIIYAATARMIQRDITKKLSVWVGPKSWN
jgi:hypothetical protein